jgi:hypothetical protein
MSVTSNSLFGHAGRATAEIGYPPGSNLEMSTLGIHVPSDRMAPPGEGLLL